MAEEQHSRSADTPHLAKNVIVFTITHSTHNQVDFAPNGLSFDLCMQAPALTIRSSVVSGLSLSVHRFIRSLSVSDANFCP